MTEPLPLSAAQRTTLRIFVAAVVPTNPIPTPALLARVLAEVEVQMGYLPPYAEPLFRAGIWGLEHLAFVMAPSHRPFGRLAPGERRVYLERWARSNISPLRNFFKALKAMVMIAVYEQPELMEHLDYNPQGYIDELKAADDHRRD